MSVTVIKTFEKRGKTGHIYEVRDGKVRALFSDVGATWIAFFVPDRDGVERNVIKGPESLGDIWTNSGSKGAIIGRNANRIAGGKCKIGQKTCVLEKNNGNNNLHSGPDNYKFRTYKTYFEPRGSKITFSLFSPDGDQGFPGNLNLYVSYSLVKGALVIRYEALCDKETVINMTNHAYFNLDGAESRDIFSQSVEICADTYSVIDKNFIPKKTASVCGTPMDFQGGRKIGDALQETFPQIRLAGGFDHNYFVAGYDGTVKKCASAYSEKTGIHMDVYTDLPCVQFYTGNGLKDSQSAYCFETQYPPNSVNAQGGLRPVFPAGTLYRHYTVYRF